MGAEEDNGAWAQSTSMAQLNKNVHYDACHSVKQMCNNDKMNKESGMFEAV